MNNIFFLIDSDGSDVAQESEWTKFFSSEEEFYIKLQEFAEQSQDKKFILHILCHGYEDESSRYYLVLKALDGSDKKTDFLEFLDKTKANLKNCLQLCVSSCHTPKFSSKSPFNQQEKTQYLEKLKENQDFTLLFRGRNGTSSAGVFGHLMRSLIKANYPDKNSFEIFIEGITNEVFNFTDSLGKIFAPEFSLRPKITDNSIIEGFLNEVISFPIKLKLLPFQRGGDSDEKRNSVIVFNGPKDINDLGDIKNFLTKEVLRILDEWPEDKRKDNDIAISSIRKQQLISNYTKKIEDLSDVEIGKYLKFALFKDLADHKNPLPESSNKKQRIEFLLSKFFTNSDKKYSQITTQLIDGIVASTPLRAATKGGDVEIIKQVMALTMKAFELESNPKKEQNIKSKDFGAVFLIEAIEKNKDEENCLKIVKLFLDHGFHPDCTDALGSTPLMHACAKGWKDVAQALIDAGADVNAKEPQNGFCVLQIATSQNQDEIAKILIAQGAVNDFIFRKNGDKYKGEWKNGQRDGIGKATFVEKEVVFEGRWKEERFCEGKVIFTNQSLYGLNSTQLEEKFKFISKITTLKNLDLSENKFDEEAIKIIAKELVLARSLDEISLSSIDPSQRSIQYLEDALKNQDCKLLKVKVDNEEVQNILNKAIQERQKDTPRALLNPHVHHQLAHSIASEQICRN